MPTREEIREAIRTQFLTKSLTNKFFMQAVTSGDFTLAEFEELAQTDPSLEKFLNDTLRPSMNAADDAAWNDVSAKGSVEAYDNYIKTFGDAAKHASEAKEKIREEKDKEREKKKAAEQAAWDKILCADTEESLSASIDEFLEHFSDGVHVKEVNEMKADLPWIMTKKRNTIEAYLNYRNNYPDKHVNEVSKAIETIEEERDWSMILGSKSLINYEEYLHKHPNGVHVQEAQEAIDRIKNPPPPSFKEKYLRALEDDPNCKHCATIQTDVANGYVTWNDIASVWGDARADAVKMYKEPDQLRGNVGDSVTRKGFSEVYFWGLRQTGKTCAIGATIGYLSKVSKDVKPFSGPGLPYFHDLQNLFTQDGICTLPKATAIEFLPHMPFRFKHNDGKFRIAQIVDVAGEVFKGIYRKMNNYPLEVQQEKAVAAIEGMLKNGFNNKIHFFIIEYGEEKDSRYDMGSDAGFVSKYQVMQSVLDYFNQNKVLSRSTYRLYALVTKTDRISKGLDRKKEVLNYVKTSNWALFMSSLNNLSKQLHCGPIQNPIAFSIGDVFAQELAIFKPEDAKVVVDAIAKAATIVPPPGSIGEWLQKVFGIYDLN